MICLQRMDVPCSKARQWSRGAKARLGRGQAVDFPPGRLPCSTDLDPLSYRVPRIASVANSTSLTLRPSARTKVTAGGGTAQ
jgi:hypothetical protein